MAASAAPKDLWRRRAAHILSQGFKFLDHPSAVEALKTSMDDPVSAVSWAAEEQVKRNNQIEKTWANPLEAALPNAPSLKIHCIYGVGKPTERSYWYAQGPYERDEFVAEGDAATCLDCGDTTTATPLEFPTGRTGWIDTSM